MTSDKFVIGIDYGTDSVRTVVVDTRSGQELASSVYSFPRWRDGLYCEPDSNQYRQHPLDLIEGLESTVTDCLRIAGSNAAKMIQAISIDTTGSSPMAVDRSGTPLSLLPGFETNPNAMMVLWKDHSSIKEAGEINSHANKYPENYLKFVGGIYSSEWFWAKLLHVLRVDENVRRACYSWVEHCDWIPFLLTGGKNVHEMKRGVCAAGHKALWAPEFGGLPADEFFSSLDPLLSGFTSRLFKATYTADQPAGRISNEWSERLNLPANVIVGVGAFDAHMGAVGGQIAPFHLSKVMGTSTCDMLVAPKEYLGDRVVRGICGQVDGSIIPGMIGLEAGQSAFGDAYAWFRNMLSWGLQAVADKKLKDQLIDGIIPELSRQAAALPLGGDDELAIDWLNGRRTPDANQKLKGALLGLDVSTSAPQVFKSLVEATCFGARAIVNRFHDEGVDVKGIIGLGGVAQKSPYVMQVMADVLNMPIRIHRSEQTCAIGAAMFAATAAGIYPRVEEAMSAMGQGFDLEYKPSKHRAAHYSARYQRYLRAGTFIENEDAIDVTKEIQD